MVTVQISQTQTTTGVQAHAAAERLVAHPYWRRKVRIADKNVSTWGIRRDCARFRRQHRVVKRRGYSWPCLVMLWQSYYEEFACPVDLEGIHGFALRNDHSPSQFAESLSDRLANAGLGRIIWVSPRDAVSAFTGGIARVLQRRRGHVDSPHSLIGRFVPDCKVTVSTDAAATGQAILFTKGYFVSTQKGFGTATPATKTIPTGCYQFGMLVANSPRFE